MCLSVWTWSTGKSSANSAVCLEYPLCVQRQQLSLLSSITPRSILRYRISPKRYQIKPAIRSLKTVSWISISTVNLVIQPTPDHRNAYKLCLHFTWIKHFASFPYIYCSLQLTLRQHINSEDQSANMCPLRIEKKLYISNPGNRENGMAGVLWWDLPPPKERSLQLIVLCCDFPLAIPFTKARKMTLARLRLCIQLRTHL